MEQQVIFIVGPTCSGKTRLGIELAECLKTEIISADSRQIYKYLSIGTAKPNTEELRKIKHHFVDVYDPTKEYNVGLFENDAMRVITHLLKKNKIPVVVGGSGLYIKAIVDGIVDIDSDEELREELKQKREKFGNEYIYNELKKIDERAAETMLPQNWKRVIRAIEVFKLTGKSIVDIHNEQKRETDFNFLQFGLEWKREVLYENIEIRVDQMINAGLVSEVKLILEKGFDKELNSLNTVGYKEIIGYLQGDISLERAVELIKRNTRRFAKRQMTWFKNDERVNWLKVNSMEDVINTSKKILAELS